MGLLQKLLKGTKGDKAEFKAKLKAAQEEDKIMNLIHERKKSANQRDLEKRIENKREEQIKVELNKLRKQDNKENWKSSNMVLSKGADILKNDRPILKEKNIFMDDKHKITFTKGGENMFFKH